MKHQTVLDNVRIASPCHARWEDMEGNERARFCGQCRKNVFNLSAMTPPEIERLVRETEGRFCGRFYARPDGRMLVNDCPTGRQQRRSRWSRIFSAVCAAALFLVGCSRRPPRVMGIIACPPPPATNVPFLMGDVYIPPQASAPGTNSPAPSSP